MSSYKGLYPWKLQILLKLINILQKAGNSIELQVDPDRGHITVSPEWMIEFFIQNSDNRIKFYYPDNYQLLICWVFFK